MKRILAIVLSFLVCIQVCANVGCIIANAETGIFTYQDFSYTVSDNEATIIEYSNWNENVDLIIPSEINGYTVTGLGCRAFGYHWNIKSVYIPESITNIDTTNTPFYFCSSIESIIVEEGNPKYRSESNCLIDIESEKLLLGCKNSIIPSDGSVTIIWRDAFNGCVGLIGIDIPNTILEIEYAAFSYCENLQSIHIPKSVRYISDYNVFMHCYNLSSITVDINNEYYHSENNCLIDTNAKTLISGCNTSVIPNDGSVTKIGGMYAFSGCTFTSFVIPDKVEVIGLGAFNACYQLKEIVISEGVETLDSHPFRLTAIEKIVLPQSVKSIGDMFFADTPIKDIYYVGSEMDRELISIDSDNSELLSADWHYDTCPANSHAYLKDCDIKCINCDWVRESVKEHVYDNNCDTSCNECGNTRTAFEHIYTNTHDAKCNECGDIRDVPSCVFTNSCDTKCNICGDIRNITHNFAAATCTKAKTCKVCGTTSGKALGHTYTNSCDTSCNVCKATRTITHAYKTTTTKATLIKNGSILKKCTVCGKVASNTAIKYVKTFKLSTTTYTYDGRVKTPSVTVKDSGGKTLKKNTDYTVTYSSGRKNVGTYKVTIKMIGKYSGTKTLTFKINPAKTTVSKLAAGKKSITATIVKKSTQVTGYQIQYSTSKTFSKATTKTISSYKTTKYTLKSLSAKKTYYVRVRTYKTVNGKKYYSGWSTYKYIKTK